MLSVGNRMHMFGTVFICFHLGKHVAETLTTHILTKYYRYFKAFTNNTKTLLAIGVTICWKETNPPLHQCGFMSCYPVFLVKKISIN